VARLARQLGHEVGLRSWSGRGSVFSITVPLDPKHNARKSKAQGGRRR
jgi:hypothetical protein